MCSNGLLSTILFVCGCWQQFDASHMLFKLLFKTLSSFFILNYGCTILLQMHTLIDIQHFVCDENALVCLIYYVFTLECLQCCSDSTSTLVSEISILRTLTMSPQ